MYPILMVTWIPSIYPIHVSIYTRTMEHMGMFLLHPTQKWPEVPTFKISEILSKITAHLWNDNPM